LQTLTKELEGYNAANTNETDKRMAGKCEAALKRNVLYEASNKWALDYDKTSLKEYIGTFEIFVDGLLKEALERKRGKTKDGPSRTTTSCQLTSLSLTAEASVSMEF
jgi:hypothetical protein